MAPRAQRLIVLNRNSTEHPHGGSIEPGARLKIIIVANPVAISAVLVLNQTPLRHGFIMKPFITQPAPISVLNNAKLVV